MLLALSLFLTLIVYVYFKSILWSICDTEIKFLYLVSCNCFAVQGERKLKLHYEASIVAVFVQGQATIIGCSDEIDLYVSLHSWGSNVCMLTHTYPQDPLRKNKVAIFNHQTDTHLVAVSELVLCNATLE